MLMPFSSLSTPREEFGRQFQGSKMGLTEQKLWAMIKEHLPGEVSRVENAVDNGMPDINGSCIIDYWVELKVCRNETKIVPVLDLLRDTQIVWNIRRGKEGALIFIIVRYEDFIELYRWIPENFKGILKDIGNGYKLVGTVRKKSNAFDWEQFKDILLTNISERINHGICNTRTTG